MSLAGGVILVKSTYFSISNHYTVQSAVLTMASLFPCGTLSSVGTFFFVLWSVVLYLAEQCRISTHYSPLSCTFLFPHAPHLSICGLLVAPTPSALCSFLNAWLTCGASICPPEPRTSSNSVNLRQAAASTLLVLTAWSFSSVLPDPFVRKWDDLYVCPHSKKMLMLRCANILQRKLLMGFPFF